MLQIEVPLDIEKWDEEKEEFIEPPYVTLQLEHSLVSLSKWESKWCKVFFSKTPKTHDETIDYIKCMTLNPNVSPEVYDHLTNENIEAINAYIDAPMTATIVPKEANAKASREPVTAELIHYWMIALQIPREYEEWHLNKLFTLIRVCNFKNKPPKKRSTREIMSQNAALNAARKKKLNTRG